MFCGLYEIRLLPTNERYIGSTVNFKNRVRSHMGRLRRGEHHCTKLQKFFNLYGELCLKITMLCVCEKSLLHQLEQAALDTLKPELNTANKVYIVPDRRLQPITRQRISKALKGRVFSQEHRKRIGMSRLGCKATAEAKIAMSQAQKGRKHSEETKLKMSENNGVRKPIILSSLDGRALCVFHSAVEATRLCGFHNIGNIHSAARKERRTAYGYSWEYLQ